MLVLEKKPLTTEQQNDLIGCDFCWDKRRKRNKELFFLDAANNMRICLFCPYCGREYEEQ